MGFPENYDFSKLYHYQQMACGWAHRPGKSFLEGENLAKCLSGLHELFRMQGENRAATDSVKAKQLGQNPRV